MCFTVIKTVSNLHMQFQPSVYCSIFRNIGHRQKNIFKKFHNLLSTNFLLEAKARVLLQVLIWTVFRQKSFCELFTLRRIDLYFYKIT